MSYEFRKAYCALGQSSLKPIAELGGFIWSPPLEGIGVGKRLADAVAGFVRAAFAGYEEMERFLKSGKRRGYISEI